MQHNPFIFGDPVRGEDFLDRRRELRRLVGRVCRGGSAVVTAEPRMGKTSLLLYLQDAKEDLFDDQTERLLFRYLSAQAMAGWDAAHFWREALRPLRSLTPAVEEACRQAEGQGFDIATLENVFQALDDSGYRLVLLLDEFDDISGEAGLHQRGFYGALRTLASLFPSFSLVIGSRRTLTDLNYRTKEFAQGSPYFNFAQEIALQPFPESALNALLGRAGDTFSADDHAFLRRVGGRHPYFLQAAAYYLWETYQDGEEEPRARYEQAGQEFFAAAGESVLADIWGSWTPYMQIAFTLSTLDSIPLLLEGRSFDVQALLRDLPNLSPELRKLERRGFLRPDERLQSGYTPHAEVMLWYLAEELTRILRPEMELEEWLVRQQWDGLLKQGEKEALRRALHEVGDLLGEGAKAFIRAAAEGAARGLTGA